MDLDHILSLFWEGLYSHFNRRILPLLGYLRYMRHHLAMVPSIKAITCTNRLCESKVTSLAGRRLPGTTVSKPNMAFITFSLGEAWIIKSQIRGHGEMNRICSIRV